MVFPEFDGVGGFHKVAASLDLIDSLDARLVVPGHGAQFSEVVGALRFAGFRADPTRHARLGIY